MKYSKRVERLTARKKAWDALKETAKRGTKRPGSYNK